MWHLPCQNMGLRMQGAAVVWLPGPAPWGGEGLGGLNIGLGMGVWGCAGSRSLGPQRWVCGGQQERGSPAP